jgi:hypothetical protein
MEWVGPKLGTRPIQEPIVIWRPCEPKNLNILLEMCKYNEPKLGMFELVYFLMG